MGRRRALPPRTAGGGGRARVALAASVLALVGAAPAPGAASEATPGVASERALLADLAALGRGELPEQVPVASLFAVRLDRLAEVEARGTALRGEIEALDAQIAAQRARAEAPPAETALDDASAPAAAPAPPLAGLQLRRDVASARLTYLSALAERLRAMPEAARRILPGIGEPRVALRERAAATEELALAAAALAGRLEELALRLGSGALVGFRSAAREQADALRSAAAALRIRGERLDAIAVEEEHQADALEARARALRREFFVTLRAPDREARMDALFLAHLAVQRRLQRSAQVDVAGADRVALAQQARAMHEMLPHPERVGTVAVAARVAESLGDLVARADAAIEASRSARDGWQLAFENEVVTVLSAQISDATRREAYAFSQSLLRDVRSESVLAFERVRSASSDWRASASRADGFAVLLRPLGLLALAGLWWLARRYTGRVVDASLRAAARAARGRFGLRVGTLVRWSGLVQAVLPVLLVYPVLRAAGAILGESGAPAALLWAVGIPFFFYALGHQLLLGATRRVTWGRPALIEVSPARLPALRRTYARLGLVVAVAATLDGIGRIVIGEGVVVMLVDALALFWVGVWAAIEAFAWRPALAASWRSLLPEEGAARERRLVGWMERSRWGFLLSPVALLRRLAAWGAGVVREISRRTDLAELIQARRLRRAARNEPPAAEGGDGIPEAYLREFPLRPVLGEDDALLLPREQTVSEVVAQIDRWGGTKGEGSIALIGEKGSGKTTLAALVSMKLEGRTVVQHTLSGKPVDGEALFRQLSDGLPVEGAGDLAAWTEGLCDGPERVVLLDEAHNVFLRTVGGYRAYDALVDVVNATSSRIFWILLFNNFTWRFLNESRARLHYFRKLIEIPSWSADELRELIRRRNRQTGFEVEFDEMLLAGDRTGSGIELIEGADGYFRLLRETSGGNPRIATRLWLSSLSVIGEKKLRVTAFREPTSSALDRMSDELLFALAAICQHENLSTDELRRVLNVSPGLARFAVQYLKEAGLIVVKDGSSDRITLSASLYRPTLRALRQKHLIFE